MPLVDGRASTILIREFERENPEKLSPVAKKVGRTPIFAVSASLVPEKQDFYMETGFDGWLLKPIDFRRLSLLLAGAFSEESRQEGLYDSLRFKLGGWFTASLDSK
jgi:CheY-like chemotaxis protein